jgi:DNA-binding protein Fis
MGHDTAQETSPVDIRVGMTLQQAEALLIAATLRHTNGNMSAAAIILNIDRANLASFPQTSRQYLVSFRI